MGCTYLKGAVIYNKVLHLKDDLLLGSIAKGWLSGSELNIGEFWGVYWINCFAVTETKTGQNFNLKVLANYTYKKLQKHCV